MRRAQSGSAARGIFAIAILAMGLTLASGTSAQGCLCAISSDEEVVATSDTVLRFKVLRVDEVDDLATVQGAVIDVYKGEAPAYVSVSIRLNDFCGSPPIPKLGATVGAVGSRGQFSLGGSCAPVISNEFLDRLPSRPFATVSTQMSE